MKLCLVVLLVLVSAVNSARKKLSPKRSKKLARNCISAVRTFERDCTDKVMGDMEIDGCTKFNTAVLKAALGRIKEKKLPKRPWNKKKCGNFTKQMAKCKKIAGFELECVQCEDSYALEECGNLCSQPTCEEPEMYCQDWEGAAEEGTEKSSKKPWLHPHCKAVCRCTEGMFSYKGQCYSEDECIIE